MKTVFEALCALTRRRPKRLRDSDPNSDRWYPAPKIAWFLYALR